MMSTNETTQSQHAVAHYEYLDALRGWAIIGVLVVHSSILSKQVGWLYQFLVVGQRGVQLFYVVSAFTLWLSMRSRQRKETHPTSNFFFRRFFRIAPMFYLALLGNLAYHDPIFPRSPDVLYPSITDIILGFTFLHGLAPQAINTVVMGGWSIAVEAFFYLTLPFLFRWFNSLKKSALLLLVASLCAPLLSYLLYYHVSWNWWRFKDQHEYFFFLWFPIEFPVFCMGILAVYLKEFIEQRIAASAKKATSLLLIVLSATLLLASFPTRNETLYLSSIGFVPLLIGLSLTAWKPFVNKYTVLLGKISYSVYLVHFFVFVAIQELLGRIKEVADTRFFFGTTLGFLVVFTLILLVSALISYATWKWIETPGIQFGRRLILRRELLNRSNP